MTVRQILTSVKNGMEINKEQAISLLNISYSSPEFYELLSVANEMSRKEYNNHGIIFAQIGINAAPCSKNCKFCSLGKDHYALKDTWEKDVDTILKEVELLVNDGINDLFLMTTADYPINKFLDIASKVRKKLPQDIRFVANIGDFDYEIAKKLREVGFTGAYHVHRLREGIDTSIKSEERIQTLNSIKKAGLELYYCVEPIGPEHSYEEMVEEMFRAKDYNVQVMAVMRRIPVQGTPLFKVGQITAIELAKIAAVTRIASRPKRAMNAHEPTELALLAGVNQLYAEVGANPRDTESNTEKNRGFTVRKAWNMLWEAGWKIKKEQ